MLVGAALYAEAYPWIKLKVLSVGNLGKATLQSVSGLSPELFIVSLFVIAFIGFVALERWEPRQ